MLKNLKEKFGKKFSRKKILSIAIFVVAVIATIIAIVVNQTSEQSSKKKVVAEGELARAMTYDQFVDGDEAVDGTDNVKFSAFFLRDVNNDGYAEKIKGTCKQIGDEDTLYMEVNVQTEGILKNGKIEIDGKNFYLATTAPKDNELKDNYIGPNIKTLEFNDMANGTQKLITGIVRSGDYSYSSSKANAIGSNINNLSRDDNKITFTGTYVGSDGNEIEINKEINLQMDWYGTASASISTSTSTYYDLQDRQNEEKGTLTLTAGIQAEENNNQLIIKKNYVEGTIPQLNGYSPISVTTESSVDSFYYNDTSGYFRMSRMSNVDENGNMTKSISRDNKYNLKIVYPLEAYKSLDMSIVTINIPVMTYYEGYNNFNAEFKNPFKSNEAKDTLTYTFRESHENYSTIAMSVGGYMNNTYVVSKRKPIRIYNEASSVEKDDNYMVSWYVSKGTNESSDGVIMKERKNGETTVSDSFVKADSTTDSMENITTNIGIGFENADKFLAEDGFIKVYDDETDELLVTFTKADWGKYTKESPFKFSMPVKHIRIETSKTQASQYFYVYSQKQLDDEYITTNYTREQFDSLKYIKSNLKVYVGSKLLGDISKTASYEAPYSVASLDISKNILSTQITEKDEILTINAEANEKVNQIGWTNGSFLIKLPKDIIDIDIYDIRISNSSVILTSCENIENENGRFIKINTQNEFDVPRTFEIWIHTDITADPRIATTTDKFELWASNEESAEYYYNSADIYDVNSNSNTEEKVHKSTTEVQLIAPNTLLTNQTASNFDKDGTQVISPQVADVKPQIATVSQDTPEKTVRIGAQIKNNYSDIITDVVILGKIPFKGNTYVLSEYDLGSEFTTKMTDAGLEVPEELQGKVVVYYSENETPDKDLSNEENGWKTAENITNWDNIKTYLIDFQNTEIISGAEYTFYYTVKVPNGEDYNKKTFSHHGVYFALKTSEGKYRTQTEPNRLGIRLAEKYNLELQKYQAGKNNLVPGATYKITREETETEPQESKTAVTNNEGKLELQGLYVKRTYIIEEIKSPENYVLNTDVIKIMGIIQEDGSLQVEQTEGTTKEDIEITKENDDQPYKITVKVEDEAKARLKVTKTDKETAIPLSGVGYKLTGEGLPESGKSISTNVNGEIIVKGLIVGEEYTLEETKAEGYYLASPIKFTISNNDGTYSLNVSEGTVKESTLTEEENLPIVNIQVEDEKIPTYNLEISKIKRITSVTEGESGEQQEENVYLSGAKFKLLKGSKELGNYVTDDNGKIIINGLYQYIDGKDEDATYTLKEILAPDGYAKVKDITFKVDATTGELKFINTEGKDEKYTVEGTTVKLIIEDSPSFKLIKKDAETGELLANIKFAIYNVDEGTEPAIDSKGEIVGTKEIINGKEYYVVKTDSNGEITVNLPEGMYKAVEVQAPDKYELSDSVYYFGIGTSREGKAGVKATWAQGIGGKDQEIIYSVSGTSDGGYIAGGIFSSSSIDLGNEVKLVNKDDNDGMIIKYNADREVEWARSVGGIGADHISSVMETRDGGYIVGGDTTSSGIDLGNGVILVTQGAYNSSDGMIIKYNASGETEWAKAISGTERNSINSVIVTNDGGYLAVGEFLSNKIDLGNGVSLTNNGGLDGMIIKYNANGETEWAHEIGDTRAECIKSATEISDGGYIVGGEFNSSSIDLGNGISLVNKGSGSTPNTDGMIIKYNANGETEWAKAIGETYADCVETVTGTNDGGFIVGGYTESNSIDLGNGVNLITKGEYNYSDGMIIKYNTSGEAEWAKAIGGTNVDRIEKITGTSDGGCVVGGYFKSRNIDLGNEVGLKNLGNEDGMIIKYSADGETEWVKVIGGANEDKILSVKETSKGCYVVGGYFYSSNVDLGNGLSIENKGSTNWPDGMIIKLDEVELPNPEVIKAKEIEGTSGIITESVLATSDGGYIVGGYFKGTINLENGVNLVSEGDKDGMIIKYGADNKIEWAKVVGTGGSDFIYSITESSDGDYIVGGVVGSTWMYLERGISLTGQGLLDGMILKYSADGNLQWAKSVGGKSYEYIKTVSATSDGGCIAGGSFESSSIDLGNGIILTRKGSTAGMIVKYNASGEVEWAKRIGGTGEQEISSVSETTDGGYIVGGYFKSSNIDLENGISLTNSGKEDGMIIKYNASGEVEWAKAIGGTGTDHVSSISETNDGGCIIGGFFDSKIELEEGIYLDNKYYGAGMVIKYTVNGEVEWAKVIRGLSEGIPDGDVKGVAETSDGGYIVAGYFASEAVYLDNGMSIANKGEKNYYDGMIIKYNAFGEEEWAKGIGGSKGELISSISETSDESYIVGGRFSSSELSLDNGLSLNNSTSTYNGMILKVTDQIGVPDLQEIEIKNERKKFKITTDVNEIDNIKGGSISGEDKNPYEIVKYGDSSTNEIKMVPDENYEIIGITVNGKECNFTANDDGSYVLPAFTNMTEDKHVVVTYALKDNKIIINKIDKNTKERISGAAFELDQIEERAEPNTDEILGELTDNGIGYTKVRAGEEVTGILGELTNNGTYYFIQNDDGTYTPTNSKTYQVANSGTTGIQSSAANSYIPIDLTGLTGQYVVVVNASCSSESVDYGYATITESVTAPSYSNTYRRFMYISGTKEDEDYVSVELDGGKKYYLHLGYRKDSSVDRNNDQVVINSVKLCYAENYTERYNFINNNGKYESTNVGEDDTVANSYIPIDLTNYTGKYNLIINAEVSSQSDYDYGYATITENTTRPSYYSSTGRIIYISGTQSAQDYTTVLQGGKMYYLHLGYYKDNATSTGKDKFTVNSVDISLNDSELYHITVETNSSGQAITQIPFGKYNITETKAPDGYWLNETPMVIEFRSTDDSVHEFTIENEAKAKVIVHHYIKGTTTKLADDEETYGHSGDAYSTSPKIDLNRYELEKDEDGNFVLPDNAVGTYAEEPTEVTYYYVEKKIPLTVHYYIEGTTTRVPLKDGSIAEDVTNSGLEGEEYTTSSILDENLSDKYELIETPSNGNGTYSGNEVIVTYYYRKISRKVNLIKYQQDGVTPLQGAVFVIDNQFYVTDAEGKIQVNLEVGTYEITEVRAPRGYKLPENPTTEITITKETTSEDISVINEQKTGTVTVHHYIEGTTTPVQLADGTDVETEVKTGVVGEIYATQVRADLSEGYELIEEPENASGIYIDGDIEVIYYYRVLPASVLVHHYIEGTTTKLAEDETIDGKVGDKYTTSVADVDEMYELVAEPDNKEGKMAKEQIVVTYYYQIKKRPYIVNYLEKDTEKVIHTAKKGDELVYGSTVNSVDEKIDIDGYVFDSFDKEVLTIGTDNNEITIYYIKRNDLSYTVNYLEKDTNQVLHEQKVQTGMTFEDEVTSQDEVIQIAGYDYESADKDTLIIKTEENVINLYYTKKNTQVIVHYYEEGTDKKLSEDVTINGKVDDPYTTVSADDVPIKYELVGTPDNASGTMTEDTIEVIYYYRVKDAVVNVRYLEKGTDIELADADRIDGKVEDLYQTSAKDIDGYQLVEYTGNEKGKFEVEPITITYYYLYKTKATVQYIDKITGEILEQSTIEGLEGDEFVTESKDFENYVLVEEPTEKTVKMTKEEQVLKYYYSRISGGVIEKHIDVISGQILANEAHEGNEGDEYDIPSRTFEGYDLVEDRLPENAKGTMKVDPVEVTYYYIYKSKVIAEYIDKETGDKLVDDEVQDGHEGDNYTTERKIFDGYKLIEVPANADGSMTKEDITVIYYYARTSGGVIVNHLDVKTNKQLLDETKEEGYEGDSYETHEENISGYDLVKDQYPENAKGTMTTETIRVTYYYIKKTEVNVKYVDKETGEEIDESINIQGHEGDDYKTETKDILGYDLVEEPENKNGTMTADPIDVIYYYRRPAKVIVNYYDADTKKKLADEVEITGHQGDSYTTEEKDIKYYKVEKLPANKDGKMIVTVTKDENDNEIVEDTTYVNYYYRKLIFNLRVDKTIASVIVNGQETAINGNLGKVEVHRKDISTANVKVVYKIKVTNDSELTGKANVVENIPSGMTMKAENNPDWTINETTASIETDEIKPGESREYQVVLGWQNGDSNIGTKENVASIVTENEAGFNEQFDTDNVSRANLIVAVGTGEVPYVAIAGGVLMIMIAMTAGVYVIKKKRQ